MQSLVQDCQVELMLINYTDNILAYCLLRQNLSMGLMLLQPLDPVAYLAGHPVYSNYTTLDLENVTPFKH